MEYFSVIFNVLQFSTRFKTSNFQFGEEFHIDTLHGSIMHFFFFFGNRSKKHSLFKQTPPTSKSTNFHVRYRYTCDSFSSPRYCKHTKSYLVAFQNSYFLAGNFILTQTRWTDFVHCELLGSRTGEYLHNFLFLPFSSTNYDE